MDFKGWILFSILFLVTFSFAACSETINEYDCHGTKIGYYVINGNVTTYYNKYGSKVYEYKNGKMYNKYGQKIKEVKNYEVIRY